MISSILVGLDSGENREVVLDYALVLGKRLKAGVHALHVVDVRKVYSPFIEDFYQEHSLPPSTDLRTQLRENAKRIGKRLSTDFKESLKTAGIEGEFNLKSGDVADVISHRAHEHDLLVIGTKGEHLSLEEVLLGSTFKVLINSLTLPMVVVPTTCKKSSLRRVLMAYDGTDKATKTLHFLVSMAEDHDLEIELLVCERSPVLDAKALYSEAAQFLDHHKLTWKGAVLKGDPVEQILGRAQSRYCDLLAFGSTPRGFFRDLLVGSVGRKILEASDVPCLIMR